MAACSGYNSYGPAPADCKPCAAPVDPGYGGDGGYAVGPQPGGYTPVETGYGSGEGGQGYNPGYGSGEGYAPVDPGYGQPEPVDQGYGQPEPAYGGGGGYPVGPSPDADCVDCGELVRTTRKVQVPCTRNEYKTYKVKVPVTVTEKVARKVNYVDYEDRQKNVCYTVNVPQTRFREEQQQYTVKVPKSGTRVVNVTKKVPKTIYVDVTVQETVPFCHEVEETRTRLVKIPYTINVPETRTKTVMEKVPVTRCKTEFDNVQKTIWTEEQKTVCQPITKMVTKDIPVYTWRQKAPGPCRGPDCPPQPEPIRPVPVESETIRKTYTASKKYDTNNDGILDEEERELARRDGALQESTEVVGANLRGSGSAVAAQAKVAVAEQTTTTRETDVEARGPNGGQVDVQRITQTTNTQMAAAQGQAQAGARRVSSRARSSGRSRSKSGRRTSSRSRSGRSSSRRTTRR